MSPLERVTIPWVVAHAFACDTITASYLVALRWEAGPCARDLPEARGRDRRAWDRQIGEQTFNGCIVLSLLPALLSGLLFWLARLASGPALTVAVTVLGWVPIALAVGGLVVAFMKRGGWLAWTADDVGGSLAQASALRVRQSAMAVAVLSVIVVATLAGWL